MNIVMGESIAHSAKNVDVGVSPRDVRSNPRLRGGLIPTYEDFKSQMLVNRVLKKIGFRCQIGPCQKSTGRAHSDLRLTPPVFIFKRKRKFIFTNPGNGYKIQSTGKTSNHSPMEMLLSIPPVWTTPQKPTDLAETQLLAAILDGSFPIGSPLPPERELSQALGITRPTLREALQRLARDGWIQIHQGKSTIVRDYWKEGNLIMLNALAQQPEVLTRGFIDHLLEVRSALAPAYTRLAISRESDALAQLLQGIINLTDTADAYSQADQELHHQLTLLSGNPIFTLIYNGFRKLSYQAGLQYFAAPAARRYSQAYYQGLLEDARLKDAESAATRTEKVMQDCLVFWQNSGTS